MQTIKQLKKDNFIFQNLEPIYINEDGEEIWNIPKDLEEFKKIATETVNWQIGNKVKTNLGTQANLSASNAKAIALLVKLLEPNEHKLNSLTELERDSYNKIKTLADNGYADSQMLNTSLDLVITEIQKGTDKIIRITSATTHEEVIEILNED